MVVVNVYMNKGSEQTQKITMEQVIILLYTLYHNHHTISYSCTCIGVTAEQILVNPTTSEKNIVTYGAEQKTVR